MLDGLGFNMGVLRFLGGEKNMGKYETQFSIKMEAEKVYDFAAQYFGTEGYRFVSGDRPNTLSFVRGSFWGITLKTTKTNLTVSMISDKNGEVMVRCYFDMPIAIVMGGDKERLELESEHFRNFLLEKRE